MSISGNIAMGFLRLVKPGKGSFTDLEKCLAKAKKENESFRFVMPKNRKANYLLLYGTERECLIIHPKNRKNADKAILYLYGGVTNQWNTQCNMAVRYAIDSGTEVWYPVYPTMTEVCRTNTVSYIVGIYERMLKYFAPDKIILSGVSMGGYYALQVVNWINHNRVDLPMPGLILAHSPGGTPDTEEDWDEMRKYEKRDPMFSEGDLAMVRNISPNADAIPDWLTVPAKGDFTNAPPTYMYFGEEMLAGNAVTYKRAYEKAGVGDKIHIRIKENMMHGYSCMPVFPESKESYGETLRLIDEL